MAVFCESERLYLRDVEPADSSVIAKWKDEELVRKMSVGINTVITKENQEEDIKRSIKGAQIYCIITVKETDKPISYIRINWLDNTENFAWLRFGLGAERGKGYSKEALISFINQLFKEGAHRIDAEVYGFNKISFSLLQSIGFKHEGTRREAYCENDNFTDIYVLGLLRSDFIK